MLFLFSAATILLLSSCNDNPTSIGLNLLSKDQLNLKQLDSYTDSLKQTSSIFSYTVPLGGSSSLMVGKNANLEASAVVLFYGTYDDSVAQDIINGRATVTNSYILLINSGVVGDSTAPFDFSVHNVLGSWNSASLDADNISSLSYDPSDIATDKTISDSLATFQISNSLATQWLKNLYDTTSATNYGIYLTPSANSKKIINYDVVGTTTAGASQWVAIVERPGDYSDTLIFYSTDYTTIIKGTMPVLPAGDIAVQGGLVVNSKLWFDLSGLPKHSVINNATLTLTEDTLASIKSSSPVNEITLFRVTDSSSTAYDTANGWVVSLTGNTYSGNIATFVQNWVDTGVNEGIVIQLYNQINAVDLYAFKGSQAADKALRPRLTITYTVRK